MSTILIGIAGETGYGKTTLTRHLKEHFGPEVTVIGHDSYYKRQVGKTYEERTRVNYDHPDAFDTDLLIEHLKELKAGRPIQCPVYSFVDHNRTDETVEVFPTKVIIVEGILIFQNPTLRDMFDIKIFVETAADVRILRRALRDVGGAGPDAAIRGDAVPHHRQAHARAVCGAQPEVRRHHRFGGRAQSGGAGDDHAAHSGAYRRAVSAKMNPARRV